MADNRMWLFNKVTKQSICLAKYYQPTGWHVIPTSDQLCDFFNAVAFKHLTAEERKVMNKRSKTGPPYANGGKYGDEWVLKYRHVTTD